MPLGARSTGGVWAAPTGSLAKVASAHASNQPAGLRSALFSSGTPFSHLSLAASRFTERYAPSLPEAGIGRGVVRSHWEAASPPGEQQVGVANARRARTKSKDRPLTRLYR